ncbi:MAG: hypothetical protein ABIH08_00365 [Candidatus Omnitrophota bacterium]
MAEKKAESFKEVVENMWPKAKKDLEKGMQSTKRMLIKGEEYLKEVSEKGVEQTKKIVLTVKKEKLYYDLGKAIASISTAKWKENKKINDIVKEVKDLSKQIKEIK